MAARLIPLGMPNVRFQVEIGTRKEPGAHGADDGELPFLCQQERGFANISSVASGGEIARVLLICQGNDSGAVKRPLSCSMK